MIYAYILILAVIILLFEILDNYTTTYVHDTIRMIILAFCILFLYVFSYVNYDINSVQYKTNINNPKTKYFVYFLCMFFTFFQINAIRILYTNDINQIPTDQIGVVFFGVYALMLQIILNLVVGLCFPTVSESGEVITYNTSSKLVMLVTGLQIIICVNLYNILKHREEYTEPRQIKNMVDIWIFSLILLPLLCYSSTKEGEATKDIITKIIKDEQSARATKSELLQRTTEMQKSVLEREKSPSYSSSYSSSSYSSSSY